MKIGYGRVSTRDLHPGAQHDALAAAGCDQIFLDDSAHSLRAGFVTHAHLRDVTDRAIAHQTRHRSLATLGEYVRIHTRGTTTPPPNSHSDTGAGAGR